MADTRLTDLPTVTTLNDSDVLYIVDTSENTSNKITYGDLINTKFNELSTSFVQSTSGGSFSDIQTLSTNQLELSSIAEDTRTQSIRLFTLTFPEISITTGNRFFSAFDINELKLEADDTRPLPEFELSDTYTTTISSVGGLSGLQTEMYLLCAFGGQPAVEFNLYNNTGATVTVPENTIFAVNKLATS